MSETTDLVELAGTVAASFEAGKVPQGTPVPYSVAHAGTAAPHFERELDGTTPHRESVHRLTAVSNNPVGARILANSLVDAIDGVPHARSPWFVVAVSDPIEDRDDPSGIRWSSTLEIRHHTTRS